MKQTFSASKKAEVEGKPTICFTGEAPFPRSKCQEIARNNGYEPISGVNKNLAVLVCSNTDTNSSKAQKARKYGTKIMGFSEWFESLENKEIPGMSEKTSLGYSNPLVDEILDI
jgi:DNA ligase (NAD+)